MNQLPNMKTFVIAAVKPLLWSLKTALTGQNQYLHQRVNAQDAVIDELRAQLANYVEQVAAMTESIIGYEAEVAKINATTFSQEQVAALERRCRELEYITGQLYDLVYKKMPDAELPDMDNVILPGDPIKTEEELEAEWRTNMNLEADVALTEEQQASLDAYIQSYHDSHPDYTEN